MKRIFLFRHAKSDWDATYDADQDRPLNPRGLAAAQLMGRFLAELGQVPDRVVCSTAVRARDTLKLAAEAGGWKADIEAKSDLYEISPADALELIRAQPDQAASVMLVGHEPTWSALAGGLVGGASVKMTTAAMLRIDIPVTTWWGVEAGAGTLVWMVSPKILARIGFSAPPPPA